MDKQKLASQLSIDEGVRKSVYQDSLGYWTIGIGRLVDARKNGGLSDAEIGYLLQNDINKVEAELNDKLPWWKFMNDARQNVLANMRFNLGMEGLLGFTNTLAAMRAGKYDEAAEGMLKSKWAAQLPARAARLANMMKTGEF